MTAGTCTCAANECLYFLGGPRCSCDCPICPKEDPEVVRLEEHRAEAVRKLVDRIRSDMERFDRRWGR